MLRTFRASCSGLRPETWAKAMITWTQVERDFEWDGSLRDIYIRPANLGDWSALCSTLRGLPEGAFTIDGEIAAFPVEAADLFAMRSTKSPMFSVKFGTATAVFHFFSEDEIECDIDPKEINSQHDLDALLSFLRTMGDAVRKPVVLTRENLPDSEIIRYDPSLKSFHYEPQKRPTNRPA